jgi:hypothetical protein
MLDYSCLSSVKFAFLVFYPEAFGHSNGVKVLLDMALMAVRLGYNICVVPCYSGSLSHQSYSTLPPPYQDLPISWDIPEGCCAILCDSLQPHDLERARKRAAKICHYTLAPIGLFQREGSSQNFVKVLYGENQAVYSPAVSSSLPFFYWQTEYPCLNPWIKQSLNLKSRTPLLESYTIKKTAIYVGKGYPCTIDARIRKRIKREGTSLITRYSPATKTDLYRVLFNSNLLICFDPLTSLAFEASLLGVPVYIPYDWDEAEYVDNYPVRLDGLSMNNPDKLLDILHSGFRHAEVVDSYYNALQLNKSNLIAFLSYASVLEPSTKSSEQINLYWQSRQSFFSHMQLPSPPGSFDSLPQAFPPRNFIENLYDIMAALSSSIIGIGRRFLQIVIKPQKLQAKLYSAIKPPH